jgi:hypothetical protein
MALNAPYSTPIELLHENAKVPKISNFVEKLTKSMYNKSKDITNPLIRKLGNYETNYRIKHKLPKKY